MLGQKRDYEFQPTTAFIMEWQCNADIQLSQIIVNTVASGRRRNHTGVREHGQHPFTNTFKKLTQAPYNHLATCNPKTQRGKTVRYTGNNKEYNKYLQHSQHAQRNYWALLCWTISPALHCKARIVCILLTLTCGSLRTIHLSPFKTINRFSGNCVKISTCGAKEASLRCFRLIL